MEPERITGVKLAEGRGPLENTRLLVSRGLRAQIQSANLLTGQKMVAMTIVPDSACSQQGGDGLFQTGQIVGGGTKQMTDFQAAGYLNPAADLSSYRKVMLDPVAIWTELGSQLSSLPANQRGEGMQTPIVAVALLLRLIGVFAFIAVLLRLL